ncbi:iron(III) transport system ATP-binding protein [Fodinibius salinus]|uniref:Iron(III) transport system ATP-binding protein n=1 Tax=Fodinibius salinus TaxID=860790 RepID=A0A5D3YL20_9BACT|nr:ABC transporter ATP-binding protein [Fodinibius salinus]TYP93391.1 iron(III) transport system ATP-binding protein [Fodinibius salinus]
MNKLLSVSNLTKSFDDHGPVVDEISFEVYEDEIFALLGPSGCGKTTSLRLISGFERADHGKVEVEGEVLETPGEHVAPQDRGIGFVFQDYALFPHLSVLENVAFGLNHIPEHKRHVYAEEVLCRTGMGDYKDRNPSELSGGQQQRVALARAIAPKPKLVLLDEPFSNLDAMLRDTMRKEVRDILKKAGMSALLVTHDQEEALSFADRIAVMNDGKIEQIGTPEEVYYKPKTKFVANFLGRTNLFYTDANGSQEVSTNLGPVNLNNEDATGRVLCSIRPEHLTLEEVENEDLQKVGTVVEREFKGHDITYHVQLHGQKYLVHTDNRIIFEPNDAVVIKPLEPAVVLES